MAAAASSIPIPYRLHDGLAVYCIGQGDPLLLMPGPHRYQIPGDGSAQPLIDGLLKLGRQVISYDPPESGHSTRPARLSMQEMHHCANEALDAVGLARPVDVMGHSMGGLTALAYALDDPERVWRLILVGTGTGGRAYMNAPGAMWNCTHPQFVPMVIRAILHMLVPRRAPEALLNNFIHRYSFVDQRFAALDEIRLRDWFRPKHGRSDWHQIASRLDYAPRLHEITAPTLVLCGTHDPQYPLTCSHELANGIPNTQLVVFDHSGHFPFVEESAVFWQAVQGFLAA